nr:putative ribonuclease H-like domain-containing protein [Tanacetum cinerariifolium]
MVWKNKADLKTMSMDDLYNNLKVYEPEVKRMSSSNSNTQNIAFVSSSNNSSTNRAVKTTQAVNTTNGVSTTNTQVNVAFSGNIHNLNDVVICAFLASQPNSPQLEHENLEQIHPDDIEEMDLGWQMTILTMRAKRFLKKIRRKLNINGNETLGFNMSKVECYNCHKRGQFAREYRASRNQDTYHMESTRRNVPVETPTLTSLVSCDGNFMPPKFDLSYTGLDEFADKPVAKNTNSFKEETKAIRKNSDALIIEEWVSDDEDENLIDESEALLRVPRKNNMNSVDLKNIIPEGGFTCLFAKATSDESKLWHRRLGQLNFKTMNKLVKGNLVRDLPSKLFENDQNCVACQKGKQDRAFCKTKTKNSISPPLHLLHMDLFSPTFVKILMKKMYCLVVIDDNSMFTWVSFLATKNETSGILKSFITRIENLVDHRVKVIRCDNGTEFNNSEMNQFCEMKVTILNTKDYLGKFDGKADEGFFVRYFLNSKAFRVFNSRTRIVEENLNIRFSVNTPHVLGSRPYWLFDIDVLSRIMNYEPIVAGTQSNGFASTKACDNAGQARKETNFIKDYILLPLWTVDPPFSQNPNSSQDDEFKPLSDDGKKIDEDKSKGIECNDQEKERNVNNTNNVNTVSSTINAAGTNEDNELPFDPKMLALEEVCQTSIFEDPYIPDRVYNVKKALYGLHQAPRAWYETLSTNLLYNGFQRGKFDKTLFIKRHEGDILLVQVYVDDIIFGSTRKELCNAFKRLMHEKFLMSSMGELTFFLGLQVKQKSDGIFISQDKYVAKILKKYRFTEVKNASTPIETQKLLLKDEDGKELDVYMYRSMIGSLMYLTYSRPDIMFTVCACARYQVNPKVSHLDAVKRIFRYLKGHSKLGLWYAKDYPFDLVAYTNIDYAGASLDRKSTTRGCQYLRCRLISWQCKKETVVVNSITKA